MYVVDASVWVSWLLTMDPMHLASRAWLRDAQDSHILLFAPTLLLPEVAGAVARRWGDPARGLEAGEAIGRLSGLELAPLDEMLADMAYRVAPGYRIRGAGAVYAALAQRLHLPLVTWDLEQNSRVREIVRALPPNEAPLREEPIPRQPAAAWW